MKNKISKFLFPIEIDELGHMTVKFRFGIFTVPIWKLYCLLTREK